MKNKDPFQIFPISESGFSICVSLLILDSEVRPEGPMDNSRGLGLVNFVIEANTSHSPGSRKITGTEFSVRYILVRYTLHREPTLSVKSDVPADVENQSSTENPSLPVQS
jgi:hypothetical protein